MAALMVDPEVIVVLPYITPPYSIPLANCSKRLFFSEHKKAWIISMILINALKSVFKFICFQNIEGAMN